MCVLARLEAPFLWQATYQFRVSGDIVFSWFFHFAEAGQEAFSNLALSSYAFHRAVVPVVLCILD
jgi:hypothetical protein